MRPQGWAPSYAPPMASSDPTEIVERMWAHEQIRQLASHYAVAVDSRDLDALVVLFVDDVRVGRDTSGRDALRASFAESLGAIGISMLTGPHGGVCAMRTASRSVASAVSGLRMRNASLPTALSMASWAGCSWM